MDNPTIAQTVNNTATDDFAQGDFAQQVRQQRKAQKLSQQELATQVGITRTYLSEIERGVSVNLSWQLREKLTTVLGLQQRSGDHSPTSLPQGLAEFAATAKLPQDDIEMLANLKYRGQQPSTPEKWELLYNMIKVAVAAK
jgi:transcriptional regulator with XRE-family HTH domain